MVFCVAVGIQAAPPPRGVSQPDPDKFRELRARRDEIAHPQSLDSASRKEAQALNLDAGDGSRVLVLLVEFGGTNTFTWTPGESLWDPFGYVDLGEWNGTNLNDAAASQFFADYHGITGPTNLTYTGPRHNQLPCPPSGIAEVPLWNEIWQPDFSLNYYSNIFFGNGTTFDFSRGDGSHYYADFTGLSVSNYYAEMSGGAFALNGDILGWISLTNSIMYYGADEVPGTLSVDRSVYNLVAEMGAIPGTGDSRTLVVDACRAAAAQYPDIDWSVYDGDGDGVIDSLWIIFAGTSESSGKFYEDAIHPESQLWAHSWSVYPRQEIADGISVGPFIMLPENSGMEVVCHEYGHALGAIDLYAYQEGNLSPFSWALMNTSQSGFPLLMLPSSMDPYHLDGWGWLHPYSITNPADTATVELYQAGNGLDLPSGTYRSARIRLEDQPIPLPVAPPSDHEICWWGGKDNYLLVELAPTNTFFISGANAVLSFQMTYDIELDWDYLDCMLITSPDEQRWTTNTVSYTGTSSNFPDYHVETIELGDYAGQYFRYKFLYRTDSNTLEEGPFIGEIILEEGGESDVRRWSAEDPQGMQTDWRTTNGSRMVPHYYYLQWRNTGEDGGYDQGLGYASNFAGRATSGLLTWYVNELYTDNEAPDYLADYPSYGAKGMAMLVDAHPSVFFYTNAFEGYPCTNALAYYNNSFLSRDIAFGLRDTFPFADGINGGLAGRPFFTDCRNYGAGVEYSYLNPASVPPQFEWSARSFDGSVVTPSKNAYGCRAPGMPAQSEIHRVWLDRGRYNHEFEFVSLPGGAGNPLDVGGEYGWNFEVIEDKGTSAVVRIWNSHYHAPYPVLVDCFGAGGSWPADDFLAAPESNTVVQIAADAYHHIEKLLCNGVEIPEAVGLREYELAMGAVISNSSVYAFFSADLVDGSRIPQQWFVNQGIPLTPDVLGSDYDGDGISNEDEYQSGTRANDAESGLKLALSPSAGGVSLGWQSEWGRWYELDVSTNLLTDPFRRVIGPLPGEYDFMNQEMPLSEDGVGFYRVRAVPDE